MLGEHSQIASLKAQLAEAKYNLEQTIVRAPSDGYVTGTDSSGYLCRVAAATSGDGVYTRSETTNRGAVPSELLAATGSPATMRKWCLMLCRVRYSAVSWQPLVQPFPAELISRPAPYRR